MIARTWDIVPVPPTQTTNELKLGILGRPQLHGEVELYH
ncbi:MAG: hypothetical protein RL518_1278 [Pseudomonadota bacterium]|jgi:hypothetical protein